MILHAQTWPSRSRHFRFALLIGVFATALAVLVGVPTSATAQPNVRPVVKGVAEVGKTVTCATGKARVARVSWKRDGRKIKGATARRYRVIRKDAGAKLTCAATARGANRAVASAPVVVTDAPTLITAPTVVGSPTVGSTLTCDPGTWTGNPTFAYSWTRDGSPAGVGTTYAVSAGDLGATIVCLAQGSNSAGASGYLQSAGVVVTNPPPPVLVYDATPTPLPGNVISYSYENYFNEWGDEITLANGATVLDSGRVTMSSWTCQTGSGVTCATTPGATYQHDITLNFYAVDPLASTGVGALIDSVTVNQAIPFRPSADPGCANGGWNAPGLPCTRGFAFNLDFDLSEIHVPNTFIASIAYNTRSNGYPPNGVPGPADSLNVGIAEVPATVGTNTDPDVAYWSDGIANTPFARDTGWGGYTPMMSFMGH